ncbi:hypothetical protein BGW36DRAFT_423117 [Talaromyces proteolyticus]|uniref:LITAF domain-containing protein n=1 Tax=Talaromyces proteolyticus TaxID=1131652 RepID=A0AAD4Q2D2_9EURO|nr:uncharacterized protein BGW36DRAFT_423117 [Talaromyces proteolyticus]KAH8703562.1 hypothetical protein BGW36DRAFT_423117 [Talaromyces proteolyticus]
MSMGMTSPIEAAPAYEEVMHQRRSTRNGYASVPQADANSDYVDDDVEQHQHNGHNHNPSHQYQQHQHNAEPSGISLNPIRQAPDTTNLPEPHTHCEACDQLLERRENRLKEKHCCTMVAVTFIMAFICTMAVGIVIARSRKF